MLSVRKHGGHVVEPKGPPGTPFDYLLPQLKDRPGSHLPGDPGKVVDDLNALGAAMVDDAPPWPQIRWSRSIRPFRASIPTGASS